MQKLVHTPGADDSRLPREATDFFVCNRIANFVHDIYAFILDEELPGLTYVDMHRRFPPRVRMEWLAQRPDLRRDIVTHLAMHAENAAYALSPSVQAERIAEVIASEDISLEEFERAFEPEDLVVYATWEWFWFFYDCADWMTTNRSFHDVVKRLLERMIEEPGGEYDRDMEEQDGLKSILTPEQFYRTIDQRVWDEHIPLWLRTKIADAISSGGKSPRSLEAVKLEFVPPKKLVQYIPLIHLKPIFFAAMCNMEQAASRHAALKDLPAAQSIGTVAIVTSAAQPPATSTRAEDMTAASTEASTAPSVPSAVISKYDQMSQSVSAYLKNNCIGATAVPEETPTDVVECLYRIVFQGSKLKWTHEAQERHTLCVFLHMIEPTGYPKDPESFVGTSTSALRKKFEQIVHTSDLNELKGIAAVIVGSGDDNMPRSPHENQDQDD